MATASGLATILAEDDYIIVAHTLGGVPNAVLATPQEDLGGKRYWIPTQFC